MKKSQLEEWVYRIIDRVKTGQPIEDNNVELKTTWVDAKKAARRLAGHANSAGGEPILWLMGVDERARTVAEVNPGEFSDWLSKLQSNFDEGVFPELLLHVNVTSESVTLVALYFETDRSPYLVKNPSGGEYTADVPWRKRTMTHSACRSQLLRLLGPIVWLPKVEVLRAVLEVKNNVVKRIPERMGILEWQLDLDLYFMLTSPETIVIPKWNTLACLDILGELVREQCTVLEYENKHASPIRHTSFDLQVSGTGVASLRFYAYTDEKLRTNRDQVAQITLELTPLESDRTIRQSVTLQPESTEKQNNWGRWLFRKNTNGMELLL